MYPDPVEVVTRALELAGGRDAMLTGLETEHRAMTVRWAQDVEAIGRILRAHLFVEHYMTERLEAANPRLGSTGRLTFANKLQLLDMQGPQLEDARIGIMHLNKIRNRIAHRLDAGISADDAAVFLSVQYFKAFRDEGASPNLPSTEPADILDEFAQYVSSALVNEFSVWSRHIAQAIDEIRSRT